MTADPCRQRTENEDGYDGNGSLTCQTRFRTCKPTTPAKHAITPLAAPERRVAARGARGWLTAAGAGWRLGACAELAGRSGWLQTCVVGLIRGDR
jgi:hypothetical protein